MEISIVVEVLLWAFLLAFIWWASKREDRRMKNRIPEQIEEDVKWQAHR